MVACRSASVVRSWRRRWLRARIMSFERDRLASQFRIDRATQELVAEEDPHFSHVAGVVADDHVLADVGRKRGVQITESLKMNAILVHPPRPGYRQEQQIELLTPLDGRTLAGPVVKGDRSSGPAWPGVFGAAALLSDCLR